MAIHWAAFTAGSVVKIIVPLMNFLARLEVLRSKDEILISASYLHTYQLSQERQLNADKFKSFGNILTGYWSSSPAGVSPSFFVMQMAVLDRSHLQALAVPTRSGKTSTAHSCGLYWTHNTCLPSTHVGHTWRGSLGITSSIDYVLLPSSVPVCSCRVLHKNARELQAIPLPGWQDQKPVQVVFQHVLAYSGAAEMQHTVWDPDAMARMLVLWYPQVVFYPHSRASMFRPKFAV